LFLFNYYEILFSANLIIVNYADIFCPYGVQRLMVWCRAGLRSNYLSSCNYIFYVPRTFENLWNPHALYTLLGYRALYLFL